MNYGVKHDRRRQELLRTVIKLSAEQDLLNMSIRQICDYLGISIGSFYHYFQDKNDLLLQVFYTIEDFVRTECEDKLGADWRSNLIMIANAFMEYNRHSGPRMVFIVQGPETAKTEYAKSADKYSLQVVRAQFEAGVAKGEISSRHSPQALTQLFFALIRGIIMDWARKDGQTDLHLTGTVALDIFITGITAR